MRRSPRVFAVFVMILTLYLGLNGLIGWNATAWMDEAGIGYWPGLFWPAFAIVAFGYIVGRVRLPSVLAPVGRLVKVVGAYYVFVFEISLLLIVAADLAGGIVRLSGGDTGGFILYAGWIIVAVVVLLSLIGWRNAWSTVVRRYELEVDKPAAEGAAKQWTIAVASDIHLGNVVGNRHLRKLVERVNAMKPDLVLLPGDVIDDSIEPFLRNKMSATLGQLKARHGVFAVLGNHEYYGGDIERYVEEVKKIRLRVLQDEKVEIAGALWLAGRKDKTAEGAPDGRLSHAALLEGADFSKPVIMMDHQPTQFQQAADAGVDLLLSGHTHRGQFAPNHLFTRRIFELDWGYMKKRAMHVVVSSGFGLWGPPIRLASRSEIIRITLRLK